MTTAPSTTGPSTTAPSTTGPSSTAPSTTTPTGSLATPSTTTPVSPPLSPAARRALQTALAGEHAAVYAYGLLGARVADADARRARAFLEAHRAGRDLLISVLSAAGEQPAAAAAAYDLPFPVRSPADARRLAALVEERLAMAYAGVVGPAEGELRRSAARWLGACAVRAAGWTGRTSAFPGLAAPP